MSKKVILLYPYYNRISGAYNRYLLLNKLFKRIKSPVKLLIIKNKNRNSILNKIINLLKIELIILYYCLFKDCILITDFNPSVSAIFLKNVFIQIHDVSWQNKNFARYKSFFYKLFVFFIRHYSNILTVSKTSMKKINQISRRKKRITYLYNSVNIDYIKESNNIAKKKIILRKNNSILDSINFNVPNLIYIATLTPRKCHSDLIEALSKTDMLFNVNLIGFPTDKKIKDLIKTKKNSNGKVIRSKINFFPKLSQRDLCTLLLYSSAYISTSMNEGFGIPVLEAYLYNIPLLLRDIEVNRELFSEAKFFNSINQLSNLLSDIKPISEKDIKDRKQILLNLNEDNLIEPYNYSTLSEKLKNIILN